MQAMDDMALLREYAAHDSEAAFEELVARRIGFVYSAALRQVREPLLAEEITQAVFILLAQKAGKISRRTILTGWLFKATRFTAFAQIRAAAKRSLRTAVIEKELQMQTELQSAGTGEIWNQLSPLLDEALAALGEKDRQAVLLRFFENKSLAEVGNSLCMGEDTARKRVTRALAKLHRFFNRRGISSTTAMIAGEISANSVQAAPVALAKSVTAVALAKGAAASTSTLTLIKGALKIMAWAKAKTAVVVGVVAILAATSTTVIGIKLVQAHQATAEETTPLSPIMKNLTAIIESNGTIRFQGTVEETNSSSHTVRTDRITDASENITRMTDVSGRPVKFAKQAGRGYLITLNKPVPPGGTVSYTAAEAPMPISSLEKYGVLKRTGAGEYQIDWASQDTNGSDMRYIIVWRLPIGATLLTKDSSLTEATSEGQIELRFDRVIPPNGWVRYSFRCRFAAATN